MSFFAPVLPPQTTIDIPALSTLYSTSQYCLQEYRDQHSWDKLSPQYSQHCASNNLFDGNINDPELYTLAGWEYIRGADPSSINPETQPLGKYIFGFSTLIFGSPIVMQYLVFATILILTYLLTRQLISFRWSLIPPTLILADQLFTNQLIDPYLDLTTTMFVLLYLYFFHRPKLAMIILALIALSKSFSIGIIISLASLINLFLTDRPKISQYLRSSWLALATYLAGYIMFFVHNHSLLDFAQLHLNIIRLYRSYVPEYPVGEIFRIIFTGQWREWYGDFGLTQVSEWSILWPISLFTSFLAILTKKLRTNKTILLHLTWIIIYLTFISIRLVFPRYLLPILPSMYIVFASYLREISSS